MRTFLVAIYQLFDYLYDIAWHSDSVFGRLHCLDMCVFFMIMILCFGIDLWILCVWYGYP